MREHAPLYRNEERDFWALSRYRDVGAALRDPRLFSSRNGISLESELWGPHAVEHQLLPRHGSALHGRYRGLVSAPSRRAGSPPWNRGSAQLARDRLKPLRDQPALRLRRRLRSALPNDVLCDMLGMPPEDWDQVRADTDQMSQREDGSDQRRHGLGHRGAPAGRLLPRAGQGPGGPGDAART